MNDKGRQFVALASLFLSGGLMPAFASSLAQSSDAAFYRQLSPLGAYAPRATAGLRRMTLSAPSSALGQTSPLLLSETNEAGSGVLSVPCGLGSTPQTNCQLDSGASMSLIQDGYSRSFPVVGQTEFSGASGQGTEANVVGLSDLRVGSIDLGSQRLAVVDMGFGIDGEDAALIGISAFKGLPGLQFDFSNKVLRVGNQASGGAGRLLRSSQGHLILPFALNGQRGFALWDTGASMTVVDPDFVKQNPEGFEFLGNATIRDISNNPMQAGVYAAHSIQLGRYDFQDVVVVAIADQAFFPGIREQGFVPAVIGYNLITRANWTMDFANGTWSASQPISEDSLLAGVPAVRRGYASVSSVGGAKRKVKLPRFISLRLPRGRISLKLR